MLCRAEPHPTSLFVWTIVRNHEGSFLLVNEPSGLCRDKGPLYWLPAGRVDRGENFATAAKREVLEEAGIEVTLKGLVRIIGDKGVVFYAEAAEAVPALKVIPDFESCGAIWISLEELSSLDKSDFRDNDPEELFPLVASGFVHPLAESKAFMALEKIVPSMKGDNLISDTKEWEKLKDELPAWIFSDEY